MALQPPTGAYVIGPPDGTRYDLDHTLRYMGSHGGFDRWMAFGPADLRWNKRTVTVIEGGIESLPGRSEFSIPVTYDADGVCRFVQPAELDE